MRIGPRLSDGVRSPHPGVLNVAKKLLDLRAVTRRGIPTQKTARSCLGLRAATQSCEGLDGDDLAFLNERSAWKAAGVLVGQGESRCGRRTERLSRTCE